MTMPPAQPVRVYADTSVYGGVFDAQFAHASGRPIAIHSPEEVIAGEE